jgi:ATP-dependent DNA helicase RecQ
MSVFHDILKQYWGYDQFRPLQEDIITSVSRGKDTLGLMPTGGGKSITFQVPAMNLPGTCLVITPLIALMKDQVDNLRKLGIKAAAIYSGMSRQEIIVTIENCIFGDFKFLYISPERIWTDLFQEKLPYLKVSMLVVDESHCISQWGYDFRPSYLRIAEIRQQLPGVAVLALTATATPRVIDDIQERLLFREKNVFRKSFERKNLVYVVRQTDDKSHEVKNILDKTSGSAIVYVRSRRRTKELSTELVAHGIDSDYFHAGLSAEEKIRKQNRWKSGECRVIVCTNAFGMGIDKPDVRTVIHYELPNSIEEYYQEAGRAGRDEKTAYAVALYSDIDGANLKRRVSNEFPDKDFVKDVYEKLAFYFQIAAGAGFLSVHDFNLENFCTVFKYNINQVLGALKILELSGYIEYTDDVENRSRLMFLVQRDEMYKLSSFDPKTEDLIRITLRSYTGFFSDYAHIDEEDLAARTGNMTTQEVYETFKRLSSLRIVHYIPAKKTPFITYMQRREEIRYVQIPPIVYEERKERLSQRIKSVIVYGSSRKECRSRMLLEYFDEKDVHDCGQCDVCLSKKKQKTRDATFRQIADLIMAMADDTPREMKFILKEIPFPEEDVMDVIRQLSDRRLLQVDEFMIKKRADNPEIF